MIDTTAVATEIRHLIVAGMAERDLLVAVARRFPELTSAELSEALQVATTAAERRITRKHCGDDVYAAGQSRIRLADELIDEATKRLAAIDRALETLQRRRRRWSTLAPSAQKELREQIDYAQAQRDIAQLELVELIELAELPIEFMGSA